MRTPFCWDDMRNIKPPLPFSGHKGHWVVELTEIAKQLPADCTVFDVFGGSGCCAHIIKTARPDLPVVWNDFDDYQARLSHVTQTESLRQCLLAGLPPRLKKGAFLPPLSPEHRAFVFDTIDRAREEAGFVDVQTLSRWFTLYTHKTAKFSRGSGKIYNRVPVVPMREAACALWLPGVVRTSVTFSGLDTAFPLDGRTVCPLDFVESQNALFVFDPPYLGTGCNDYRNADALRILQGVTDCCECLPCLLFGDVSIAFWYELLFKGRNVTKYKKQINSVSMSGTHRSEVLFACLPA